MQTLQQLQNELLRQAIWFFAWGLICLGIAAWVWYAVIKAAIRDGIKESGLVDSWAKTVAKERKPERAVFPDIRPD